MFHAVFSWRGLAVFWVAAIAVTGVCGGILQALGPIPRPPQEKAALAEPHPRPPDPAPSPAAPATQVAGPNPALLEPSPGHPAAFIPRVGADGQTARVAYAAPAPAVPDGSPRVALLVSGFGLSERDSREALQALPGPVSLAVSAYAAAPPALYDAARAGGHELLASIPMEPKGYPLDDEGDRSLLTGLTPAENRSNLEWALGRTEGAVGATGASDGLRGERFADVSAALDPILDEIARRGLLYVDPIPGQSADRPGLAARTVDIVIDDPPTRAEIEAKLAALERMAREKGSAIGLAGPLLPNTIDRIADWAKGLKDRGIALVPVSLLVTPPKQPVGDPPR